ncbi:MAG: bifunctional diaminohydroxyphosphoribosylaminopyrimidine deaminase/5-amino-6-(5-phosphoribosylamino)uracil reductase RibD [Chitinophagaceae bacterium]
MTIHEKYMHRCLQLATLGKGFVSPNPMVGAVLVYDHEIIGEGYHMQFGQAHAEVNCINSVAPMHQHLIKESTLYVSLEPCNHFGKTPPCSHLIVEQKIKQVVVGCIDTFNKVNGTGIAYLKQHGVDVITNVLEYECRAINKYFFYYNTNKLPYIILKFAETADGIIGNFSNERLLISNPITNILVDAWRQEVDAIFVGKNTVIKDNPTLITKHHSKRKQVRMFVDDDLEVGEASKMYNDKAETFVFNLQKTTSVNNIHFVQYSKSHLYKAFIELCYKQGIQSVLIEGGTKILQFFIDNNWFNECRVITNSSTFNSNGIKSPVLKNHDLIQKISVQNDTISIYKNATI